VSGAASTYSVAFTVPASADVGANVLPNLRDPNAKIAQQLCPGYIAQNVTHTEHGFKAILELAGPACNAYGNDIESLAFEYAVQSSNRLRVSIQPRFLGNNNHTQYLLAEELVPYPKQSTSYDPEAADLQFSWSNEPSFSFRVIRKSTGDVVFDTTGSVLVYEDQFIEFVSQLPKDHNIFGLGEQIHNLRLGDNYNATIYAADAGDPIR